jgi:hypothetical protein
MGDGLRYDEHREEVVVAEEQLAFSGEQDGDIIFDCPECGKSLAIDPQGAGLVITCPDCATEVRVPGAVEEEPLEPPAELDSAEAMEMLEASRRELDALNRELAEVNNRRLVLEHIRSGNLRRMEKVSDELAVIQSALDRINALFEDAASDDADSTADT